MAKAGGAGARRLLFGVMRRRVVAVCWVWLLVVVPPVVVVSLWGWPSVEKVSVVFSAQQWRGGTDDAVIVVAVVVLLGAWAWVVASLGLETMDLRRGVAREDVNGLRLSLRPVLAAVVLKSAIAGSALTATFGAEALAHPVEETAIVDGMHGVATDAVVQAYEVVRGDTLWGIAERRLGDGLRWREIHDLSKNGEQAIRGKISDPNLIYPGDIVLLPADATPAEQGVSYARVAGVYGEAFALELAGPQRSAVEAAVTHLESFGVVVTARDSEQELIRNLARVGESEAARGVDDSNETDTASVAVADVSSPEQASLGAAEVTERELTRPPQPEAAGEGEAAGVVIERGTSMRDIAKVAVGSLSLVTVSGLAVTMARRRRRAASTRRLGEMLEPFKDEVAVVESEILKDNEEIGPWVEWLAMVMGDFAARRRCGSARVEIVEGSERGVEMLLSGVADEIDWSPWKPVHGDSKTVLALTRRDQEGLHRDVDGWGVLPLLVTVGDCLMVNFERAGVVSVVTGDDDAGGGAEAAAGLCRAIISELMWRKAEWDTSVRVSDRAAAALGGVSEHEGVSVQRATAIDEEISDEWRYAAAERSKATAEGRLCVDDDRLSGNVVSSHLVVCSETEVEHLTETMRLAKQATHNLAVLVLGAAETETRLEVSVPGGEMIAHPWGIRVAASYASNPTAATINEMATAPTRMVPRVLASGRRDTQQAGTPRLSEAKQPQRFSHEHVEETQRAAYSRPRPLWSAEDSEQRSDPRMRLLNRDAVGGARRSENTDTSEHDDKAPSTVAESDNTSDDTQGDGIEEGGDVCDVSGAVAGSLVDTAHEASGAESDDIGTESDDVSDAESDDVGVESSDVSDAESDDVGVESSDVSDAGGDGSVTSETAVESESGEAAADGSAAAVSDSAASDDETEFAQVVDSDDASEALPASEGTTDGVEDVKSQRNAEEHQIVSAQDSEADEITSETDERRDAEAMGDGPGPVVADSDVEQTLIRSDEELDSEDSEITEQQLDEHDEPAEEASGDAQAESDDVLEDIDDMAQDALQDVPEDVVLEDVVLEDVVLEDVVLEDVVLEDVAVDDMRQDVLQDDVAVKDGLNDDVVDDDDVAEASGGVVEDDGGGSGVLGVHNGPLAAMGSGEWSESMRKLLRRQESLAVRLGRLSGSTVRRLASLGSEAGREARWAVLMVGPIRVVRLDGERAGDCVEVLDTAASLGALLAVSGTLSSEEAQACLRFGSNEHNWQATLRCLKDVFGDDFVDEAAGLRLKGSVADLVFFESGLDSSDLAMGLELLRGEVFDVSGAGSALWDYDGVVEQLATAVADWCAAHAQMLLVAGNVETARRVVKLGLLSEPHDRSLLEADMACMFDVGGRDAALKRVAEHCELGVDSGDCAQMAFNVEMERRGEIVRA